MKILINKDRELLVKDLSKDFHTEFGFVKSKDLKKNGRIKTNKKVGFSVFDAGFIDLFRRIKRNAQIITAKDAALIAAEAGINKNSKVVDCGGGSGALTCFLANICKEVYCYEIRKDFIKTIKYNIGFVNLKNVKIKNKDVYKKIDEKDVDLITMDLPEAWKAIKNCEKSLKAGGFLVAYFPNILQLKRFFDEIEKNKNFSYLKAVEVIQREWDLKERVARPKFDGLGHTGFLIFARRI